MYFLLPAREITNPTVKEFKASLSQYNDLNYHTVPLCNYKNPHADMGDETVGTKSIKKSNPAIKSKPLAQAPLIEEEDSLKCDLCGWNYPKNFVQHDKHSHFERCKNGNGETDKRLWQKCKNDILLFRKKIKAREESRYKESEHEKEKERERERERDREEKVKRERKREREKELDVEKKREEEKEFPKKGSAKKTIITMEIESSEDSDLDIPIQKKSSATLKRQNPSTQIQVFDLEREDLKRVKKTPTLPPPVMKMVGRKSATKAVFNPPPSSNTVYTID